MLVSATIAAQASKIAIPQDVISLVQMHQPYMGQHFLTSEYDWSYIKKNFSNAKLEGSIASYVNNENVTIWHLNDQKKVTRVTFKFNLAKWKGSGVEKKLLKQYRDKLTPEEFSKVPSDTRTITVKDKNGLFELDVFFPVSDYESPAIRSVSIRKKAGGK